MRIRLYLIVFFLILMMFPYVMIPLIIGILLIDTCIAFYNLSGVKKEFRYIFYQLYRYTFRNDHRTKRLPKP